MTEHPPASVSSGAKGSDAPSPLHCLHFFYQTSSSNLAIAIKGIKCKNVEHKISLYADDVLLFLQHLQTTFSEVNILINSFCFIR